EQANELVVRAGRQSARDGRPQLLSRVVEGVNGLLALPAETINGALAGLSQQRVELVVVVEDGARRQPSLLRDVAEPDICRSSREHHTFGGGHQLLAPLALVLRPRHRDIFADGSTNYLIRT